MDLPPEVPVMILPNAILFPQVMLPLYIYEPRYRKMLRDSLESHRTIAVAMQQPGHPRGTPSSVAGLGLIRAAVTNRDGTSHIILQGMARVQLTKTLRKRPYRVEQCKFLSTTGNDSVVVDALSAKVLDLVAERFKQGLPLGIMNQMVKVDDDPKHPPVPAATLEKVMEYLGNLEDADQLADLVSCTLLSTAKQRQTILETIDLEARLKHLIHFLISEIEQHGNS
jgi:ATP-dependent Lon protease